MLLHPFLGRAALATTGLAAIAAAPVLDDLQFGPEAGTSLTKTFETTVEFSLDDLLMNMNGQEIDPSAMGGDLDDASGTVELVIEVTDEYGETQDGRPASMKRSFDALRVDYEMGSGESGSETADDIEGKTVTFTWNEDEGVYDVTSEDDDFDSEDGEMLSEDMDHRALLPGKSIEEGDTWDVSGTALMSLMVPGIDITQAMNRVREGMESEEVPFDLESISDEVVEGIAISCTYSGLREVGEKELQVITLSGEMEQSIDLTDMILETIRSQAPAEIDMDLSVSLELAGELEGEALWDSAAGHLVSCEWTLEMAMVGIGDMDADFGGQAMQGSAELEVSGAVTRKVSFQ